MMSKSRRAARGAYLIVVTVVILVALFAWLVRPNLYAKARQQIETVRLINWSEYADFVEAHADTFAAHRHVEYEQAREPLARDTTVRSLACMIASRVCSRDTLFIISTFPGFER